MSTKVLPHGRVRLPVHILGVTGRCEEGHRYFKFFLNGRYLGLQLLKSDEENVPLVEENDDTVPVLVQTFQLGEHEFILNLPLRVTFRKLSSLRSSNQSLVEVKCRDFGVGLGVTDYTSH